MEKYILLMYFFSRAFFVNVKGNIIEVEINSINISGLVIGLLLTIVGLIGYTIFQNMK